MWRIRLARELPRYLLCTLTLAGILASMRFAVAPPTPRVVRDGRATLAQPDRAAEGYATLFARRYLTWSAPEGSQAEAGRLAPFFDEGSEGAALGLPVSGEQHVQWAEVVQAREAQAGVHVYTVAAQTDTGGLVYLTVPVARGSDRVLRLSGYPALVGAPAARASSGAPHLREVGDAALATVVERALRNYLAGSAGELAADLTSDARVSPPPLELTLESVQSVDWSADGSSVVEVVKAQDRRGVQYTLAYELDVVRQQGRWEVAAIEMDPNA
jgi:hypothetical protein